MSPPVFISYASQDRVVADRIREALELHGYECWIDHKDINPSENWRASVMSGIRESKVFVVVFSKHTNASD